ncbi:phosphatase DCR2 [Ascosphaera apis ARSEF 7405]|uniref:Phosphatase DCR2 n=1 Tax=Ascosphaera apis ARSEF 7405 TaxID=392613 RepID=A0A167WM00_9EURO|nr:phosphatase DCR2 [Ascosphaera apis ARSEF 7405]
MVPRRMVRTGVQLAAFALFIFFLIFIADSKFRLLPTAIHDHLPSHHPGLVITDVKIITCSSLNPFSKCMLNPAQWHRIDKNLYLDKAWTSAAYIHIQRKREEDLASNELVVTDLKIGRLNPGAGTENQFLDRSYGIWIQRQPKSQADFSRVLTSIDVLYGADAAEPRPGWELKDMMLLDAASEPRLSIRRQPIAVKERPVPRIRKDGKFKIMQLADLHLSTGTGLCRDPVPKPKNIKDCEADPRTLQFVDKLLEDEKPDLVVLSGDQVNGDTAPDAETAIFKIADLLAKHKVPYASIFGNHDDEGNLDRTQSMEVLEQLPYSLARAGPQEVDGVGNYYVEVMGRGTAAHSALTLYLLDTHSYSQDKKHHDGYDWIRESQINWFREAAQSLKKDHKAYTHIHMNLAFIHIPLPEYRNSQNMFFGNWTEAPTAPSVNSGFKDELVKENVVLVSCGHDHVNDYCMLEKKDNGNPGIWLCYGGATGFGGYAGPGYGDYIRRARFFDIDMNSARIITYKRLEWGETEKRFDEMMVVDGGHPIVPVM